MLYFDPCLWGICCLAYLWKLSTSPCVLYLTDLAILFGDTCCNAKYNIVVAQYNPCLINSCWGFGWHCANPALFYFFCPCFSSCLTQKLFELPQNPQFYWMFFGIRKCFLSFTIIHCPMVFISCLSLMHNAILMTQVFYTLLLSKGVQIFWF